MNMTQWMSRCIHVIVINFKFNSVENDSLRQLISIISILPTQGPIIPDCNSETRNGVDLRDRSGVYKKAQ